MAALPLLASGAALFAVSRLASMLLLATFVPEGLLGAAGPTLRSLAAAMDVAGMMGLLRWRSRGCASFHGRFVAAVFFPHMQFFRAEKSDRGCWDWRWAGILGKACFAASCRFGWAHGPRNSIGPFCARRWTTMRLSC